MLFTKFRAKQTKFELLYAQKCRKKELKPIKSQPNMKFPAQDYYFEF